MMDSLPEAPGRIGAGEHNHLRSGRGAIEYVARQHTVLQSLEGVPGESAIHSGTVRVIAVRLGVRQSIQLALILSNNSCTRA